MAENRSEQGYGRKWPKYVLIYLVVGGAIYALVYFLFLSDGVYGS
jgi:hypothetical protein